MLLAMIITFCTFISCNCDFLHDVDRVNTDRDLDPVLDPLHGDDDVLHLHGVHVLHHVEWPRVSRVLRFLTTKKS